MLDDDFKKSAMEKVTTMSVNEYKEAFKAIGSELQTNEDWLHMLNTEQFADKLTDFSFWLVVTIPTEDKRERVRKRIVEWLKQPHTTIKE